MLKQTRLIGFFIIAVLSAVSVGILSSSDASAYTCKYSGDNGNYKGKPLQSDGGGCYIWKTGDKNNDKRDFNPTNGTYSCTGGAVLQGEDCYDLQKEYTNIKPTNDDGSAVDERVWVEYCDSQDPPLSSGTLANHMSYDSGRHRCYAENFCNGRDADSVNSNCFPPGQDGHPDVDSYENLKDPTAAKVQQCEKDGGAINKTSHNCEWTTQAACNKRPQGAWVNNRCQLYSDATTKEECDKIGGDFKVTGKNNGQDVWTCVKKGTNPQTTNPADGSNTGTGGKAADTGTCGQSTTNLISCSGSGVQAIGDVLRQIIVILTILIGIAAVGGIAYAAVLYASATDNASQTQNAISLLRNIVIGILVYGFMIAIINWLVPGGVIG